MIDIKEELKKELTEMFGPRVKDKKCVFCGSELEAGKYCQCFKAVRINRYYIKANKKYDNFGISVWNYNREYNTLKYFYKESNNNNNTYDTNPLQQVISLMISNYTEIIKYSHTKSIYSL